MKIELQQQLFDKYPLLFVDKDADMRVTCMCWGIETSDGWKNIIDEYCKEVYPIAEKTKDDSYPFKFMQVKEKYGTLRLYTTGHDPDGIVDAAESKAYKASCVTCEQCGSTDNVTQTEGWIVTLCEKCMKERNEK